MSIATEIVTFKIRDTVSREQFIRIADHLELHFHAKQPGFLDSELLCDDRSGVWTIIQHWQSLELMQAASRRMFQCDDTQPFRDALDKSTISMTMLPRIRQWVL